MDGLLVQDWATLRGADATSMIVQSSTDWVDLGAVEDLVLFLDVREVTSGATIKMYYETAPVREQGAFVSMLQPFTMAVGTRVDRCFSSNSGVAPARYLRWRLSRTSGAGTWDATFRLWAATYAWRRMA